MPPPPSPPQLDLYGYPPPHPPTHPLSTAHDQLRSVGHQSTAHCRWWAPTAISCQDLQFDPDLMPHSLSATSTSTKCCLEAAPRPWRLNVAWLGQLKDRAHPKSVGPPRSSEGGGGGDGQGAVSTFASGRVCSPWGRLCSLNRGAPPPLVSFIKSCFPCEEDPSWFTKRKSLFMCTEPTPPPPAPLLRDADVEHSPSLHGHWLQSNNQTKRSSATLPQAPLAVMGGSARTKTVVEASHRHHNADYRTVL